ncbi:ribonuclease H-like domain-containing protein [Tanacetum coccineum]
MYILSVINPQGSNGSTKEDERAATSENDSENYEGGNEDVPDTSLSPVQNIQNQPLRRSDRSSVFPDNYNEYVVDSRVKFGLERFVSYVTRNSENFCFTTELNKVAEISFCFNSFLHGDLDETIYMILPDGLFNPGDKKVCRLKKSLYGLKQTPRQWNAKLTHALLENDFCQSKSDYSLFTKSYNNEFLAQLVYVDDIIVTGSNVHEIKIFKEFFKSKFMIKDLGKLKYFFGIEVVDTNDGICLSQMKYCLDLLSDFGLLACKPYAILLEQNLFLSNEPTFNDHVIDNITDTRMLRYLKGSPGKGIHITKSANTSLVVFVDADWAKFVVTRKSVTGFCIFVNASLVSWKSKKQNTLFKSYAEAKYRAIASATSKTVWILKKLKDLN